MKDETRAAFSDLLVTVRATRRKALITFLHCLDLEYPGDSDFARYMGNAVGDATNVERWIIAARDQIARLGRAGEEKAESDQ